MTNKRMRLILGGLIAALSMAAPGIAAKGPKTQTGRAMYYSDRMDGHAVALKGEKYDKGAMTAATHGRFPLGSMVTVTNLKNNKTVTVKVNDRMNPTSKAIIDLSRKAAEELDMIPSGHANVKVEMVDAIEAARAKKSL